MKNERVINVSMRWIMIIAVFILACDDHYHSGLWVDENCDYAMDIIEEGISKFNAVLGYDAIEVEDVAEMDDGGRADAPNDDFEHAIVCEVYSGELLSEGFLGWTYKSGDIILPAGMEDSELLHIVMHELIHYYAYENGSDPEHTETGIFSAQLNDETEYSETDIKLIRSL